MKVLLATLVAAGALGVAAPASAATANPPKACDRALDAADDLLALDIEIERIIGDIVDLEVDSRDQAIEGGLALSELDAEAMDEALDVIDDNDAAADALWEDHNDLIADFDTLYDQYTRAADKCRAA